MEKETNHIPGIGDHPEETPLYGYKNREVFYFFDKGKGYIQKVEPHNNTVQVLIKQGWDIIEDKIEEIRKKAEAGLVSPIAFHMERCLMDLVTLAGYSGFPKWRIRDTSSHPCIKSWMKKRKTDMLKSLESLSGRWKITPCQTRKKKELNDKIRF